MVSIIDDFSYDYSYIYVYLIVKMSDLFEAFKDYKAELENQLEKNTKVLRADRGDEYCSYDVFEQFYSEHHVCSNYNSIYISLNGTAERRNHTFMKWSGA